MDVNLGNSCPARILNLKHLYLEIHLQLRLIKGIYRRLDSIQFIGCGTYNQRAGAVVPREHFARVGGIVGV